MSFVTDASRGVSVAIAEGFIKGKHKATVDHVHCATPGQASSQWTVAAGGLALIIQDDDSADNAPDTRQRRMTAVFGRVGVFIGSTSINLPCKLIAEAYEVVVRIHRGAACDSFIEAAARIFEVALSIERDLETVAYWYCSDPIAVLGDQSALQLVEKGEGLKVLEFLESIKVGEAD